MENTINALHRCFEDVCLQDVTTDVVNLEAGILTGLRKVFHTAPHEVVINDHLPHVFFEERVNRMGANQASATDHEEFLAANVHQLGENEECSRMRSASAKLAVNAGEIAFSTWVLAGPCSSLKS